MHADVYDWHKKSDTICKQNCAKIDFRRQDYSHLHYLQFLPDALDE